MTKVSIHNLMEKIKQFLEGEKGKDVLIVIVIVLVALGSFGLGRLSKKPQNGGLQIEYTNQVINGGVNALSAQNQPKKEVLGVSTSNTIKTYFASSRGSKYYYLGCTGGKELKEENKIYFNSEQEAINAGYEKSVTCR